MCIKNNNNNNKKPPINPHTRMHEKVYKATCCGRHKDMANHDNQFTGWQKPTSAWLIKRTVVRKVCSLQIYGNRSRILSWTAFHPMQYSHFPALLAEKNTMRSKMFVKEVVDSVFAVEERVQNELKSNGV